MAFPASFLDELSARNPIEDVVGQYVALTRKGSNMFGLCPFHSEKTASFSVAPDKNIYYCFGCHKGGGPVNFIMEVEGLDFPDAVRFLAKKSGMEVPEEQEYQSTYRRQERLRALCKDAARFFHDQLEGPLGQPGRDYINKRGFSRSMVTKFGLGYAPEGWSNLMDAMLKKGYTKEELLEASLVVKSQKGSLYDRFRNRLMFPIIDVRGNIIGFGGRVLDDSKPKYLNSGESIIFNKRKNLYALNFAKKSQLNRIILTEGYVDTMTLYQYGFDCAVASLGTALTEDQAQLLAKYTTQVVLTYDGDAAGQDATRRAIPILEKAGLQVKILRMQGAKDPDEFLKNYGADRFRVLLEQSENQAEYRLTSLQSKYDLNVDEQRVDFLKEAALLIATFPNSVTREVYAGRIAETAGVTTESMRHEVERAYKRRRQREQKRQDQADLDIHSQIQPNVKGLYYSNPKSARAEEQLIAQILKEPNLLPTVSLLPEQFSSTLLGRAFGSLQALFRQNRPVSLATLQEDFTAEEMSHLTSLSERYRDLVSDKVVQDCTGIIREEYEKTLRSGADALAAMHARLKDKKGYGG